MILNVFFFTLVLFVLQPWATCLIRLGWGLALVLAPVWVHLGRPLDQTCLETCWVLIVRPLADSVQLTVTPLLLPTQASSTSVSTSATATSLSVSHRLLGGDAMIDIWYTPLTVSTQQQQTSLQYLQISLLLDKQFSSFLQTHMWMSLPLLTILCKQWLMVTCKRNLIDDTLDICVLTDKLVNDVPKMTSSASQPDLLSGWDSWAAGNTASMGATASSKPSYTNTGRWRNIL